MTEGWTAIVPLKPPGERKTRLAPRLATPAREALATRLFGHVLAVLLAAPAIARVVVLSASRFEPAAGWIEDEGRGLNAELEAARHGLGGDVIVVHADLPLLTLADLAVLAARGAGGCAVAPDRHFAGTNALALAASAVLPFAFGPDSFRRYLAAAARPPRIVARPGLALDIDTPDDLDDARRQGFAP